MQMSSNEQSRMRPLPTPRRMALQSDENVQLDTVTSAQGPSFLSRFCPAARMVMESSAVKMRQSVTRTRRDESMSSPSPLYVCGWRTVWM